MTKLKSSRILAGFLAFVMVIGMLPINISMTVNAETIENYSLSLKVENNDYKANGVKITMTNQANISDTHTVKTVNGKATFENFVEKGKTYKVSVGNEINLYGYKFDGSTITVGDNEKSSDISLERLPSITISGKVTDEGGNAYEGAKVTIKAEIDGTEYTISDKVVIVTGEDGSYTFKRDQWLGTYAGIKYNIYISPKDEDLGRFSELKVEKTYVDGEDKKEIESQFSLNTFEISTNVKGNGTIVVNEGNTKIPYNSERVVNITANPGYRIEKVTVTDSENKETDISEAVGKQSYEFTLKNIKENYTVSASFCEKKYKVIFTVGKDGKVTYDDNGEQVDVGGGSINVEKEFSESTDSENSTKVDITATPDSGYRVSRVTVDETEEKFEENDYEYKVTLEMKKDYKFAVEFSKNVYSLSVDCGENGTANWGAETETQVKVEHGADAQLTIVPNEGFIVKAVKVKKVENDEEVSVEVAADEVVADEVNKKFYIEFGSIEGNKVVKVEFSKPDSETPEKKIEEKKIETDYYEITSTDDWVEKNEIDGYVVILYPKGTEVTVTPKDPYYNIKESDKNPCFGYSENITITENKVIENIYVKKSNIAITEVVVKVKIIIANTDPTLDIKQPEPDWTNANTVTVEGTATDNNGCGLHSIVWSRHDELTDEDILKSLENNTAKLAFLNTETGEYSFESENGEQNDKYYVYAVDKAGNVSDVKTVQVKIDQTAPTLADIDQPDWTNADTVTVEGTATDTGCSSELSHIVWSKDAELTKEQVLAEAMNKSDILEDGSYSFKSVEGEQNSTYYVYAVDKVGNVSDVKTVQVKIDQTAPEIVGYEIKDANDNVLSKVFNFLTFGIFFNEQVEITVTAKDAGKSAGVKSITLYLGEDIYKTESCETKETTEFTKTFTIPASELPENNVLEGLIKAKATDWVENTGDFVKPSDVNTEIKNSNLMIENVKPTVSITANTPAAIDKNSATMDNNDWYANDVEFTVIAKDTDSGIRNVVITINESTVLEKSYYAETTKTTETTYTVSTAGVDRKEDGSYTIQATVIDNAGNENKSDAYVIYKDIDAPYITEFDFQPTDYVEQSESVVDENDKALVVTTDYGFYFMKDTDVIITAKDVTPTAGIKAITYYTVDFTNDAEGVKSEEKTILVNEYNQITVTIPANFKGQIYAKATDNVGNAPADFVNPNGVIVENADKHKEEEHISFEKASTEFKQKDGTDLYAGDVDVKITVTDTYSGIREMEWEVIAPYDAGNKQRGKVSFDNTVDGDEKEGWTLKKDVNLIKEMSKTITVTNNSNNIKVKVKMTDRAGNTSEKEIKFGIDKTAPELKVEYDNNEPDEVHTDYYDKDRTATITITERNFKTEDVNIVITNTDGVIPGTTVWQTFADAENPDKTINVATITYSADGDYTFDISYKDNAGNAAKEISDKFTIDKTKPVVTVTYDNNSAKNGNYYKDHRKATITIREHNFDATRVNIIGTADDVTFPSLSNWTSNGDVHTATINYAQDAKYTFDIDFKDMAGNQIEDFSKQEFHVDTTTPVVSISGIVDKSANSQSGNIGYVVTATDKNFDVFISELNAVLRKEDGTFATEKLDLGMISDITNGQTYTVTNIETDGIYSIVCNVVDKAGNEFTEVILEDASGAQHKEQRSGADSLAIFSVNRNGSVFNLNDYTKELIKTYYVKNATENVTVIEINADELVENTVTLNGKTLVEGTDYTVNLENSAGTWYKYTYSINKSLFDAEGEYIVVISSVDEAENKAFSDVKNVSVKFVVDRTAPTVTVSGMQTDGRYQAEKQVVTLVPADDGGALKSLIVRTVDENGNVLKELINLSDEALAEALAEGNITFEIAEGLYQNVQVICEDYAGNISGAATSDVYENISVSSSAFMIFWADKTLRYGTIAGITVFVVGAVIAIIFIKRKKK